MRKKAIYLAITIVMTVTLAALSCDNKLPTVSITSPEDGAFVEGKVVIRVEAQDDKGIDQVYFYIDDNFITADGESPYEYTWDVSELNPGTEHEITVTAYDRSGNDASDEISVTIGAEDDIPPDVTINHPSYGSSVGGELCICVEATDNIKVDNVIFFIDDVEVFDDNTAPYEYDWNTAGLEHDTEHYIDVFAYDQAGNEGRDSVRVIIDIMHPEVSIMEPDDGARVWGIVPILVDAVDNDEVVYVDFYIDDSPEPIYADGEEPFGYNWNTVGIAPETTHSINVVAYDEAGNEAQDEITVTVGE